MKSAIKLISTADMSQEDWLRYRKTGIGASETGIIMGLSPYKASIALFYEKIGEDLGFNVENLAMFLGKEQEEFIATLWEFWHTDQATMIRNYRAGARVRRCKRVNAYARNDKYPWLFVSLDREINQHDGKGNGALEIKTIGGYESDKWEAGIPPIYIVQLNTQMLVCDYQYGELAIMRDNRDFMVYPFERSKPICDQVVKVTRDFWKRVEVGRIALTKRFEGERTFNMRAVEQATAELQAIEPPTDHTDAFNNFLKEKYSIATPGEKMGTIVDLDHAAKHFELAGRIKELQEKKQLHENVLKNIMRDGCDKLTFGANGYVSWKGEPRRFLNKYKP